MEPNLFQFTPSAFEEIERLSATFPEPRLEGHQLCPACAKEYRERLQASTELSAMRDRLKRDLSLNQQARGYLILDCSPIASTPKLLSFLTAVLSLLGTPIRVFDKWDLWKRLPTKLDVDPKRAMGVGLNPLHIDIINSTRPPDYSCLLCVNEDPGGGGANLISNLRDAIDSLSPSDACLLKEAVFIDGHCFCSWFRTSVTMDPTIASVGSDFCPKFSACENMPYFRKRRSSWLAIATAVHCSSFNTKP